MKQTLLKIEVILITFILSFLVSSSIAFSIGVFVFSERLFVNLMSNALLIIAFCVLYKPIKKLILKEGEISIRNAKNTIYVALGISVVMGIVCFCTINRTFSSDYDRIVEDIQMINEQCPIKGEESELNSVELINNTLIYNYLYYEYRERTIEMFQDNKELIKENIRNSLMGDKEMIEQIKNNNIKVRIIYKGNRSNKIVDFIFLSEDFE